MVAWELRILPCADRCNLKCPLLLGGFYSIIPSPRDHAAPINPLPVTDTARRIQLCTFSTTHRRVSSSLFATMKVISKKGNRWILPWGNAPMSLLATVKVISKTGTKWFLYHGNCTCFRVYLPPQRWYQRWLLLADFVHYINWENNLFPCKLIDMYQYCNLLDQWADGLDNVSDCESNKQLVATATQLSVCYSNRCLKGLQKWSDMRPLSFFSNVWFVLVVMKTPPPKQNTKKRNVMQNHNKQAINKLCQQQHKLKAGSWGCLKNEDMPLVIALIH